MSTHNAPAIVYFAGRPTWLTWALALVGLTTVVMLIAWYALIQTADWRLVVNVAAAILALVAIRSGWQQVPCGVLAWDKQAWSWTGGGSFDAALRSGTAIKLHGIPVVIADFQRCLLVQIKLGAGTGTVSWLWLVRSSFPERWLDLRRAIYSRPRGALTKTAPLPAPDAYGSAG